MNDLKIFCPKCGEAVILKNPSYADCMSDEGESYNDTYTYEYYESCKRCKAWITIHRNISNPGHDMYLEIKIDLADNE